MKKKRREYKSYFWRVRTYTGTPYVGMWLVGKDNMTTSGMLYGVIYKTLAEGIIEFTGLEVERETAPYGLKKSDRKDIQKKTKKGHDWNQTLIGVLNREKS